MLLRWGLWVGLEWPRSYIQSSLISWMIKFASHENDWSHILLLDLQVVDTPYLVNPEWKNFIPGYMYNDSDLELTAESLYRQRKTHFYVFRWQCYVCHLSEATLWWGLFSLQPILHLSSLYFMFTFGYKTKRTSQQTRRAIYSITVYRNTWWCQFSTFLLNFCFGAGFGSSIKNVNECFISTDWGCKWEGESLLTLSSQLA